MLNLLSKFSFLSVDDFLDLDSFYLIHNQAFFGLIQATMNEFGLYFDKTAGRLTMADQARP